jgi:hypothetical protein
MLAASAPSRAKLSDLSKKVNSLVYFEREQLQYASQVSTLLRLTRYRGFGFSQRDFLLAADSVSNISIQSLVSLRELRHAEMCDDSLPSRGT